MTTPVDDFARRLDEVMERLRAHASRPAADGFTDPDTSSGERWEWGQVWAHLAEFVPYWVGQIRTIVRSRSPQPVDFGRTKKDEGRIAAIERDRGLPPAELFARLESQAEDLRRLLDDLSDEDWERVARHPTLGDMAMPRIVDEFLVGHLEEHAAQLDALASG